MVEMLFMPSKHKDFLVGLSTFLLITVEMTVESRDDKVSQVGATCFFSTAMQTIFKSSDLKGFLVGSLSFSTV